jgi:hypothetical protein
MRFVGDLSACLFVAILLCTTIAGQQPPQSGSSSDQNKTATSNERVVGVVPAFNVAPFDTKVPLKPSEKFNLFVRGTLDPFSLIAPAVKAGILNAAGLNSDFGPGIGGFAKRYGASMADATSGRFFRTYMYPVALHEDPRYFRRGTGGKKSRTWYSVSRVFVTRTDEGNNRFNWSKLLASFSSAGLSNAYYPSNNRGVGLTFTNAGLAYMGEAGMNVVKEFWPDISRARKQKKQQHKQSSFAAGSSEEKKK